MANEDCFIVEDDMNPKSVTCTDIPKAFLDKSVAKTHFGRFGVIHSFILRPKQLSCTVEYESTDAAKYAMDEGYYYADTTFEMNYTKKIIPRQRSDAALLDPDVQMELKAMGGNIRSISSSMRAEQQLYKKPSTMLTKRPTSAARTSKPTIDIASASASPKQVVDVVAKHELESILKKPAYTSEEKFRVLDARDKLIRLTTARMTDINSVVSIRGVCPDMCPEKERLMREATHHVATFELEENSKNIMQHKLAVKQYARSSADQEFPLGHELRPEPVLQMTMNYLLHNIVDLCENPDINLGDWFHFLWDRTRSIRKEISQQELCSQAAVSLVEQCARLHIQCAARLVAEEPQVFDQKINSENLTKCLQSLKYLYHDLHLRNEQCPNEAEFRAYVVLLNLNDCQFFWEVKQLPHHILHSPQIRFALNVYSAVESNNYVKFFKLVRETTYMNACILLRYFTQVRVNALNILLKAYVPRGIVMMTISYWTYCLAFEDFEQTAQFFEYYGLQCERDEDHVLLDRQAFVYPDIPFLLERAINVVEHKRECTVGEVIHGKSLGNFTDFQKHEPHDSFDDNGYLLPEAWNAEDQNYMRPPTPKRKVAHHPFRDEPSPFKVPVPPQQSKTQQSPKPSIFTKLQPKAPSNSDDQMDSAEHSPKMLPQITAKPPPIATKPAFSFGGSTADNLFTNKLQSSTSNLASSISGTKSSNIFATVGSFNKHPSNEDVYKIVPSIEIFDGFKTASNFKPVASIFNAVPAPELESFPPPATSAFSTMPAKDPHLAGISPLPIDISPPNVIVTEQASEKLKRERNLLKAAAQQHLDQFIAIHLQEELQQIAASALREHQLLQLRVDDLLSDLIAEAIQEEMDTFLTETIHIINQNLTRKYFALWRRAVHRIAEKRATIESTPMWLPDRRLSNVLSTKQQRMALDLKQRYRSGVAEKITLPSRRSEQIDVRQLVADQLRVLQRGTGMITMRRSHYWKGVLSVPEFKQSTKLINWLTHAFVRSVPNQADIFYCEQYGGRDENVAICLRKLVGAALLDERGSTGGIDVLAGANGVLFYISDVNNLSSDKRRLDAVQRSRGGRNAHIGVICHGIIDEQQLRSSLDLSDDVAVFMGGSIEYVPSLLSTTVDCLKWLVVRPQLVDTSDLMMQSMTSLLLQCLGDVFWNRIARSADYNPGLTQVLCKSPVAVIKIYNDALERIIKLTTPDTISYPDFPNELRRFVPKNLFDIPVGLEHFPADWNEPTRYQRISQFFTDLKLQSLSLDNVQTIEQLHERLLTYAAAHMPSHRQREAERAGYQMIQAVMTHLENRMEEEVHISDSLQKFSWVTPMKHLTLMLLSVRHEEAVSLPSMVIFLQSDLKDYTTSAWWLHGKRSPLNGVRVRQPEPQSSRRITLFRVEPDDMQALLADSATLLANADRKMAAYKQEAAFRRDVTRELNISLDQQEQHSRLNKRFLASAKMDDHDVPVIKRHKRTETTEIVFENRQSDRDRFNEIFAKAMACAERADRKIMNFRRLDSPM